MDKAHVQVTVDVTIHDPQEFWDAAFQRLQSENGTSSAEDAAEYLGSRDEPDLAKCAQMLIDPGASPAGCEIEQSHAEDITSLVSEVAS